MNLLPGHEHLSVVDSWLTREAPMSHVVISSRARYARNLPRIPFPLRAAENELHAVARAVEESVRQTTALDGGLHFPLRTVEPEVRAYLRESHLISAELETGAPHRHLYLSRDVRLAIMANEEDHLRMFAIQPGLQATEVLTDLVALETEVGQSIPFAFSPRFGYLTACPTNTGTGLRISIMMHLPGLTHARKIHEVTSDLPSQGMVGRGFRGENSNSLGDLYQISNDVTLGLSEERIAMNIMTVIQQIIDREEEARAHLIARNGIAIEDEAARAYGILRHCRGISTEEAIQLVSRLRFAIVMGLLPELAHCALNRLLIELQPAHLSHGRRDATRTDEPETVSRATMLRARFENMPLHTSR